MLREEINIEIKEALGKVPGFFEQMPDETIESEWKLFQRYVLSDNTAIPPKYRELIGIAVAAANGCWYCSNFHSGVAGLHGATPEEINEANLIAKFSTGWSSYLNGSLYDKAEFMEELGEIAGHLGAKKEEAVHH